MAARERVRRRQGSRAHQGRRLAHLLRRRPRLPRRQARARLRPGDLRAGRRPPRLLRAAEGRRAGARLRRRAHRDRALPDGASDRGRRAEAHVQAARRRRAARRADGRHRRGRRALLSRAALARRADRHRPRPGGRAGPGEPRLLRAVRARPHLLDPAPCGRRGRGGSARRLGGAGAERGSSRARARRLPRHVPRGRRAARAAPRGGLRARPGLGVSARSTATAP